LSAVGDIFKAVQRVMLLQARVDELADLHKELLAEVRDHDRRLVRIETMIEMSERRSPRRLKDD